MATTSEIKAGLDEISGKIKTVRERFEAAKNGIIASSTALGAITTAHSDVLTTIDAFTPTGAFETLAKDEKAKLQTEFVALKAQLDALIAQF